MIDIQFCLDKDASFILVNLFILVGFLLLVVHASLVPDMIVF